MRGSAIMVSIAASLVIAFTVAVPEAGAKDVAGTHTRGEIAEKCAASGGTQINTKPAPGNENKSYGCFNADTGAFIDCNNKGKCWTPDPARTAPPKRPTPVSETFTGLKIVKIN